MNKELFIELNQIRSAITWFCGLTLSSTALEFHFPLMNFCHPRFPLSVENFADSNRIFIHFQLNNGGRELPYLPHMACHFVRSISTTTAAFSHTIGQYSPSTSHRRWKKNRTKMYQCNQFSPKRKKVFIISKDKVINMDR